MTAHPILAGWRDPDSSGALQLAGLLAEALSQPLELLSAYRYEPAAFTARIEPTGNEIRFEAAHARVRRARTLVPEGVEVRERVAPAADVAVTIEDVALDIGACLIVVGRDVSGHATRSLVPRAPCPVAISPFTVPIPGAPALRAIGVADDGSPNARLASIAAERLAAATGGRLTHHAIGPDDGDPGTRLVEASEDLDLLVCGSHGRGRIRSAVLGSVSRHLTEEARCAVLVVPPDVRPWDLGPLGLSVAS